MLPGLFERVEELDVGGIRISRRKKCMLSGTEYVMFGPRRNDTSNDQPNPQLPENFQEHNGPEVRQKVRATFAQRDQPFLEPGFRDKSGRPQDAETRVSFFNNIRVATSI